MVTLSNPLQTAGLRKFVASQQVHTIHIVSTAENPESIFPKEDGLGCMRGLAVAMLCNIVLGLMIVGAWELWRFLR